jgi:RNA polymerase sigma factor (sigma-70 family)
MEDSLTEAWLKLPAMLGRYNPEMAAIKTYLSKQLYWTWLRHCYGNICRDEKLDKFAYRKEYYEPLVEGVSDIELDRVDTEDERNYIISKIKEVDKRGQVVLSLRYINGMTMSEIALVLGCVKSMVHVYVHRALDQIAPVLENTYGSSIKTAPKINGTKVPE